MSELVDWPEPIKREGPYKVYKGHQYTVYDDGNSAETPYQTDLAEAALARLRLAVEVLESLGQGLGCKCGGKAVSVAEALSAIGPVPEHT
jgi:hypothetical protein